VVCGCVLGVGDVTSQEPDGSLLRVCAARRGCDNGLVIDAPVPPPLPSPDGVSASGVTGDGSTEEQVLVRRAPRYRSFVLIGVLFGVLVALVLTFTSPGPANGVSFAPSYDKFQVFGYLLIACVSLTATLGACLALLFDQRSARRSRTVTAQRDVESTDQHG